MHRLEFLVSVVPTLPILEAIVLISRFLLDILINLFSTAKASQASWTSAARPITGRRPPVSSDGTTNSRHQSTTSATPALVPYLTALRIKDGGSSPVYIPKRLALARSNNWRRNDDRSPDVSIRSPFPRHLSTLLALIS
jgi:hypothetical protein